MSGGTCSCGECVRKRWKPRPSITISTRPNKVRISMVVDGVVSTKEMTILQADRLQLLLNDAKKTAQREEWRVLGSVDY